MATPKILAQKIDIVPVTDLVPHPDNPRRGKVSVIKDSIRANDFFAPLIVQRSTKYVLAGNHRLQAAVQSGMASVPVVFVDVDEARAKRILLVDNRTNDLASYDETILANLLQSMATTPTLDGEVDPLVLDGTGYSSGDLAKLLANDTPPESTTPIYLGEQIVTAALAHFRATGFPYPTTPTHVAMQEINDLAMCSDSSLIHSTLGYRVPDPFHPHRFAATAEGRITALAGFSSDKILRKAFETELLAGRRVDDQLPSMFGLTQSIQIPSNFRPGFALWLLRRFCPAGGTWLDTSTGYGGRLVAFAASGAGRYIGIDPSTKTHDGNTRMASALALSDRIELINQPAEDVAHKVVAERADFAFTSPPYFSKEHYAEESTQSWVRYGASPEKWLHGFLEPMMALQFAALKPASGCLAIVNIADVRIKNKNVPLEQWTIDAGVAAGFLFLRREDFPLPRGARHSDDDKTKHTEAVLIFEKP